MRERPILFSSPMVRAILAGTKTQTRRIVKPQPDSILNGEPYWNIGGLRLRETATNPLRCKYGSVGDALWVRETFVPCGRNSDGGGVDYLYRANLKDGEYYPSVDKWRPSIFMPRIASRITLEIVNVHVERLQDISEEDAEAEGLKGITKDGKLVKYGIPDSDGYPGTDDTGWPWEEWRISPVDAYRKLWESINGEGSWDANPWVWVIEFKRIKP